MEALENSFVTPIPMRNSSKRSNADLEDRLLYLLERNKRDISDRVLTGTVPFVVHQETFVELAFAICRLFGQPAEVRYRTLEIFDRFLAAHFLDLYKHIKSCSSNQTVLAGHWQRTKQRINNQMVLRLLSCMQIASKFENLEKRVSLRSVHNYLQSSGCGYSLRSIGLSEWRVFEVLDFKIPLTPLAFMEALVEVLQPHTKAEDFLTDCQPVLDRALLQRQEIYLRFFWMATNRWERSPRERVQFMTVELDYMLLAAAVIVSTLQISQPDCLDPQRTAELFSGVTGLTKKDIMGLALVISQIILPDAKFVVP